MDQPLNAITYALDVQAAEIKGEGMLGLAEVILKAAPGSFWKAPASSTGKYHPPDERGPGGLVLHTARVMRLAKELAIQRNLDMEQTDMLLLAALMHDLYKGGPGEEPTPHTWPLHPVAPRFLLGGNHGAVTEYVRSSNAVTWAQLDQIWRAVETHEGRWSVLPLPPGYGGLLGELLHLADYIASRDFVHIEV